jgi:hypothetical protein
LIKADGLKSHLTNSCPKVEVTCVECEEQILRANMEEHSCVTKLKASLIETKREVATLKDKITVSNEMQAAQSHQIEALLALTKELSIKVNDLQKRPA